MNGAGMLIKIRIAEVSELTTTPVLEILQQKNLWYIRGECKKILRYMSATIVSGKAA